MKQLRSWHLSALKVISEPMSALARTSERDCRTRTTDENCTANESWTRTKYAYDGDNLIEGPNATGGVVARYEDTQNSDEPLAMLRSSATSYFHADALGSITSRSNAAGSIDNTSPYASFRK